jgi:hypothetical protein
MILNHQNRPGPDFGRKIARRLACRSSNFSRVGAWGNPGAIQDHKHGAVPLGYGEDAGKRFEATCPRNALVLRSAVANAGELSVVIVAKSGRPHLTADCVY